MKAEIIINKPLKYIFEFVENKENKIKTDKNFDDGYDVRKISKELSLIYQKYNGRLGFSARDYYLLACKKIIVKN